MSVSNTFHFSFLVHLLFKISFFFLVFTSFTSFTSLAIFSYTHLLVLTPILKFVEESENEIEIVNKALLNNLEDEELLVDELKVEEESQVVAIENALVKIDTFTFPMDFVT